jgi:diadenosine tetraphosphate (Ap4A) HIT family hydrolase
LLVPKAPGYAAIIDLPPDVAANVLSELPRLARAVKEVTGGINIAQVLI